jgi:predicted anti-sigma-YlaC factor YlaD
MKSTLIKLSKTLLFVWIFSLGLSSCSINKMIANNLSEFLSGADASVFTNDDDPQLIGDALPVILKLYELFLSQAPENRELLLTTGQAFMMYAYAFVQYPADMLPIEEFEKKLEELQRAKNLYLRARGYILKALELKYPEFADFTEGENWEAVLKKTVEEDVPYLYNAALAWFGAFTADSFDMELIATIRRAVAMMNRVLELDETYDSGGVHTFFVSYFGSLPPELGGDKEKALFHFNRAIELSEGLSPGPYMAYATSVCMSNGDYQQFEELLKKILEINIEAQPESKVMNILAQKRAQWLLDHIDDYFLIGDVE